MSWPVVEHRGERVRIAPATALDVVQLGAMDWRRSLHPALGGWVGTGISARPGCGVLHDDTRPDSVVGAVDAQTLPGYPGVVNVSLFVDEDRAPGGAALEAYGVRVSQLFEQGARRIHQEVLVLNRPIRRLLRGLGFAPEAVLREHGWAAGRFWDVEVFSFDRAGWEALLGRFPRAPVPRAPSP